VFTISLIVNILTIKIYLPKRIFKFEKLEIISN
jgi:hypothetical protein